jgi:hypothetical protein
MNKSSNPNLLVKSLRDVLTNRFSEGELRTLCVDMNIEYENLPGSRKADLSMELVAHCVRHQTIPKLIGTILCSRPDVFSSFFPESIDSLTERARSIPFEALDTDIYFLDVERCAMTRYYIDWTENANNIDIIALSMQAIFENWGDKRLINWLMGGKNFRILTLSPGSASAEIRGKEEGIPLPRKIVTQMERLKSICERTQEQIVSKKKRCLGSLEVWSYDGIPYFAYFGTEREIVIGLYYTQEMGLQSESFLVDVKSPLYRNFQCHFNTLWDRRDGSKLVCRISESESYFMD